MKLSIQREALMKPLQMVAGAVERRQTQAILSNVLLVAHSEYLSITATDLEVELVARVALEGDVVAGRTTVPARKFIDICKNLADNTSLSLEEIDSHVLLRAGRSRFTLSTLPADNFPSIEQGSAELEFSIKEKELRYLIEAAHFSMAQNDVRYYLNGLLFQINAGEIRTVATDGHRLATCHIDNNHLESNGYQVIVPRKGINELMRLLSDSDDTVTVALDKRHLRITADAFSFMSKLIDGRFPDYERVIPKGGDKFIVIERDILRDALSRVSILSNEKYRAVRFQLRPGILKLVANNPEQEEAEEELEVDYAGTELDIGFNVSYLLDILNNVPAGNVQLTLTDAGSSLLISSHEDANRAYVVMPMRL